MRNTELRANLRIRLDDAARDLLKLADDVRSEDANYAGESVMSSHAASSRGRNAKGTPRRSPSLDADDDTNSTSGGTR